MNFSHTLKLKQFTGQVYLTCKSAAKGKILQTTHIAAVSLFYNLTLGVYFYLLHVCHISWGINLYDEYAEWGGLTHIPVLCWWRLMCAFVCCLLETAGRGTPEGWSFGLQTKQTEKLKASQGHIYSSSITGIYKGIEGRVKCIMRWE